MEETTIQQPANQQLIGQSLITMDDMFIQIGKLHIDKINSDKIAESLAKRLNKHPDSLKLEESIRLYQENNKTLAEKVQELSRIIEVKNAEIGKLKSKKGK